MSRLLLLALVAALAVPASAQNPTIVVNTLAGDNDGSCDAAGSGPADDCSFLEAVAAANAQSGADQIEFGVSGTISITSTASISGQTVVDGSSAPSGAGSVVIDGSSAGGTAIEITGQGASSSEVTALSLSGSSTGILVSAGASDVRIVSNWFGTNPVGAILRLGGDGVVANNAPRTVIRSNTIGLIGGTAGIVVSGSSNDTVIASNFLGTGARGERLSFDAQTSGIVTSSSGVLIGGAGEGNLVGLTGERGIFISGGTGVTVQGNLIGTGGGGRDLGNRLEGILVASGASAQIGGTRTGEGNIVAFNGGAGIRTESSSTVIEGNFVGTDSRDRDLGNRGAGIDVAASNVEVGGTASGAGNTIRFNGDAGVLVASGSPQNVSILGNRIFDNDGLGIDLGGNGVSQNDATDSDSGPNGLQNFPVLSVARTSSGANIGITLTSTASTTFRVEVFSSTTVDPTGFGEGATLIGTRDVTTNSNGVGSATLSVTGLGNGSFVTATATRINGSSTFGTSEFSRAVSSAPRASFELARTRVMEGDSARVKIVLSEPAERDGVSVEVAVADADSSDLGGFSKQTVTFDRGDTMATIAIPIARDGLAEMIEEIELRLQNPMGLAIFDPLTTIIEIAASGVGLDFAADSVAVQESAGTYDLEIEVGDRVGQAGTVVLALVSGESSDIGGFESREIVIPVRSSGTTITVQIPITNDEAPEPDEVVRFVLRSPAGNAPTGFSVTPDTLSLTILNDDGEGVTVTVPPVDENGDGIEDGGLRTLSLPVGGLTAGAIADAVGAAEVFGIGAGGELTEFDDATVLDAGQPVVVDVAPGTDLVLTGAAPAAPLRFSGVAVGGRVLVAVGNPDDRNLDLDEISVAGGSLADVALVFDATTGVFRPVSLSGLGGLDDLALGPFEVVVLQVTPTGASSNVSVTVPVTGAVASSRTPLVTESDFEAPDEEVFEFRVRRALDTEGDRFALRFGSGQRGLDPLDGIDVTTPFGPSISAVIGAVPFSVVALEELVAGPGATVPLEITVPRAGAYEIDLLSVPEMIGNRPVRVEILDSGVSTVVSPQAVFVFRSAGAGTVDDLEIRVTLGTAVDSENESLTFPTLAVYPNPSAGATTVALEVVEAGPVRVAVYDALGREVAVLEDGSLPTGEARFVVEGLAPGAYVVRADGEGLGLVRSLTVVR